MNLSQGVFAQVAAGRYQQVSLPCGDTILDAMVGCPQTVKFHGEGDVATHTWLVLEQVERLLDEDDGRLTSAHGGWGPTILRLAALLHDVGKPDITRPADGVEDVWRSPGHAKIGAQLVALLCGTDPTLVSLPVEVRWAIHTAVRNHMWCYEGLSLSAGAVVRSAHLCDPAILAGLWEADGQGRICVDPDAVIERRQLAWLRLEEIGGHVFRPWLWLDELGVDPAQLDGRVRQAYLRSVIDGRVDGIGAAHARLAELERRRGGPTIWWTWGLPGAGKSTWAEQQAASLDAVLLTTAGIVRRKDRRVAHGRARQQLDDALGADLDVIVDATHLGRSSRDRLCGAAERYDATLIGVVFDAPLHVAVTRQDTRDPSAYVPPSVVRRMAREARWPTPDEYGRLEVHGG